MVVIYVQKDFQDTQLIVIRIVIMIVSVVLLKMIVSFVQKEIVVMKLIVTKIVMAIVLEKRL
jgi:hypothetical protein